MKIIGGLTMAAIVGASPLAQAETVTINFSDYPDGPFPFPFTIREDFGGMWICAAPEGYDSHGTRYVDDWYFPTIENGVLHCSSPLVDGTKYPADVVWSYGIGVTIWRNQFDWDITIDDVYWGL